MSIALQVKVRELELSLANALHRIELLEADVKALTESAAALLTEDDAEPPTTDSGRATLTLPKKG